MHRLPLSGVLYVAGGAPLSRVVSGSHWGHWGTALEFALQGLYTLSMAMTLEQLAEEAMKLPAESRAVLADQLVESLDLAEPDAIQRLWAAEAIRRRDEVRSGKVKPVPGGEVIAEVRRLVGR